MKSFKYLVATGLLAASVQAGATLLTTSGGVGGTIPIPQNDFAANIGSPNYELGANLYFGPTAYPFANLEFTFLAKEAGWESVFSAYGAGSLSNRGVVGSSFTVGNVDTSANGGLLDFDFEVVGPWYATLGTVENGSNSAAGTQTFAVILNTTFNSVAYDALLLWDDAGGGNDDNHDDHIIGLNISKVPEPGTMALLGLGLLGLGISRRRSK